MGFESTIPVFEQAKTVHALDGSATVIGTSKKFSPYIMANTAFIGVYLLSFLKYVHVSFPP
jgi:hypothetical protein